MKNFLILLFISTFLFFHAQEKEKITVVGSVFLGEGSGNFKGRESNHSESYQLGISKKLDTEKDWVEFLNAKNISLSLVYSDFDGIVWGYSYGKGFGAVTEVDFQLLGNEKFQLYFTPSFGLLYATKTALTDNNTFIFGSHINGVFNAAIKPEFRISNDFKAFGSINFKHYSNGSFRIPNAGINIVGFSVGIKKDFEINAAQNSVQKEEIPMKKNGIEFSAGLGRRGKYRMKEGVFRMGYYVGYNRFLNKVIALRIGADGSYYGETYDPENYQDTPSYLANSTEHFRYGLSVGTEIKMSKIALVGNIGKYLYFKGPNPPKIYWNAGLKYYISPKFGLQGTLNAHEFQADYVNWGLFYRL